MRKKIQPLVRDSQSGPQTVVGKFPVAEAGNCSVYDSVDPEKKNDGIQPAADDCRVDAAVTKRKTDAGRIGNPVTWLLIAVIKLYQKTISPWLPCKCRFTPTCSHYAVDALREHGFFKGTALTVWRLMRCQPFCRGGYDPVPPAKPKGKK